MFTPNLLRHPRSFTFFTALSLGACELPAKIGDLPADKSGTDSAGTTGAVLVDPTTGSGEGTTGDIPVDSTPGSGEGTTGDIPVDPASSSGEDPSKPVPIDPTPGSGEDPTDPVPIDPTPGSGDPSDPVPIDPTPGGPMGVDTDEPSDDPNGCQALPEGACMGDPDCTPLYGELTTQECMVVPDAFVSCIDKSVLCEQAEMIVCNDAGAYKLAVACDFEGFEPCFLPQCP